MEQWLRDVEDFFFFWKRGFEELQDEKEEVSSGSRTISKRWRALKLTPVKKEKCLKTQDAIIRRQCAQWRRREGAKGKTWTMCPKYIANASRRG